MCVQIFLVKALNDRLGKAAAAHRIHLGFDQSGQVVGDLLVGDGGTEALGLRICSL